MHRGNDNDQWPVRLLTNSILVIMRGRPFARVLELLARLPTAYGALFVRCQLLEHVVIHDGCKQARLHVLFL